MFLLYRKLRVILENLIINVKGFDGPVIEAQHLILDPSTPATKAIFDLEQELDQR